MSEEGINFKILQALGTRTGQALDVQVIHPETSQVREEKSRIVQKLLELLAKAELMKSALEVVAPDSMPDPSDRPGGWARSIASR